MPSVFFFLIILENIRERTFFDPGKEQELSHISLPKNIKSALALGPQSTEISSLRVTEPKETGPLRGEHCFQSKETQHLIFVLLLTGHVSLGS